MILPTLVCGEIIETDSMITLLDYIQKDTFVIADIDNTLIESECQLGSSQWGDNLGDFYTELNRSFEEVDHLVADTWCKVQPLIKVRCVDPQTAFVIQSLHENGIMFMGLTARRPSETHFTLKQLASTQITLSANLMEDGFLESNLDTRKGILFHQGIIFCTPMNKKSGALKLFFTKTGHRPKRIIFIDDKLSHVRDVGQFIESLGIDYVGIRFSGADERVKSFNPQIALIQYDHLPELISDEAAALILEHQSDCLLPSNK